MTTTITHKKKKKRKKKNDINPQVKTNGHLNNQSFIKHH